MPQLTFALTGGELQVKALLGVGTADALKLVAAGQPVPRSVWVQAVIDTGTSVSSVSSTVIQQLGVPPAGSGQSTTAGGSVKTRLFKVSLTISHPPNVPGPLLTFGDMLVTELVHPLGAVDLLIGMDVLLKLELYLDGPRKQFTLTF